MTTATTTNEQQVRDIEAIKATIDEWNNGLDSGDLERMIATCDPDAVTCNDGVRTVVGLQGIRDKYAPRIAASTIKSGYEYEHIQVFGDVGVVVGHFTGEMTDKVTGQVANAEGRLVIAYRRGDDGSWKMILDMDNNGGGASQSCGE